MLANSNNLVAVSIFLQIMLASAIALGHGSTLSLPTGSNPLERPPEWRNILHPQPVVQPAEENNEVLSQEGRTVG